MTRTRGACQARGRPRCLRKVLRGDVRAAHPPGAGCRVPGAGQRDPVGAAFGRGGNATRVPLLLPRPRLPKKRRGGAELARPRGGPDMAAWRNGPGVEWHAGGGAGLAGPARGPTERTVGQYAQEAAHQVRRGSRRGSSPRAAASFGIGLRRVAHQTSHLCADRLCELRANVRCTHYTPSFTRAVGCRRLVTKL